MSSNLNFEQHYEDERPTPTPPRRESAKDKQNLAPLKEERQVPTGLENPFWKPDDR